MEDDWSFYMFDDQGAPSSNALNLAFKQIAPVPSHGILGLIEVSMLAPRADGLPTNADFEAFGKIEDAIVAQLEKAQAYFCGCTTGRGVKVFAFYAQTAKSFEDAARAAMKGFPAYPYDLETKTDADWTYYFDFLMPSPEEYQRMRNAQVFVALERNGDTLVQSREIDHWIYFEDSAAAHAFASAIMAERFELRTPVEPTENGKSYVVQAMRVDFLRDIDAVTLSLSERATALGGTYDGWECPVVK